MAPVALGESGRTRAKRISAADGAALEADPGREHFHWFNWHFTGYDRVKGDAGCANYIPSNLGEIPDYYRRFIDPPAIAVLKTCSKDEHGFYNSSLAALWHRAIVERVRRPPPHQRHRRPVAVRTRCPRLHRRKIVHLHVFHL